MLLRTVNSGYYHLLIWLTGEYSTPIWAVLITGTFVVVTLTLSIYLMFEHLSAYKNPEEQKFLLGVILMVPCYAVESFVSMVHPAISVDVGIARDCYESFAMYCFWRYLIACLVSRSIKASEELVGISGYEDWNCLVYDNKSIYRYFSRLHHLHRGQMGLASAVHLYVFPAKPYELMGDLFSGSVAVLGDYASVDCQLDPDEVRDSQRPTKLRLPQPDYEARSGMTIRESVKDVFLGGSEYIVNDVKFTVTQAVEPVEKGITKINQKWHKISENIKKERTTKDDSCISSLAQPVIRGIDDPLLNGSFSDNSSSSRRKKHQHKSGYTSAESGNESSIDTAFGGYKIHGRHWFVKD
ncbi:protein LAZ1-like isoform X1 [Salvia divinorum]|uniref:Protein LAZ1-like isoform X1 n=1 Tax=Salvia divinorum TaxID=28513 RepID=A0ABD1I289_SALDI